MKIDLTATYEALDNLKDEIDEIDEKLEELEDENEDVKENLREILDLAENWDIRPGYRKLETKQDLIDVIRGEIL